MSGTGHRRIRWLATASLTIISVGLIGACGDDDDDNGAVDLEATCEILAGIEAGEDISDETLDDLDALIEVAPDEIKASVQTVRDAFEEQGEAAFDDPEVGTAFETVGTFEERECSE